MKYSTLEAFEKHLESATADLLSQIYMLLSKEAYPREQALQKLTALALQGASRELNLKTYDAEQHDISKILRDLEELSFFAKKRVVVVQNADAFNKAATTKLEAYFKRPNKSVCLILVSPAITRSTTFYKNAELAGVMLDIPEQKPWEKEKTIAEWLRNEAARKGKLISHTSCQQLVKQLGTDQSLLSNELEKLCCYIGDKPQIEDRDVAAICGSVNVENIWQLGEAVFRFDAPSAIRIMRSLLDEGSALIALIKALRSQFQTQYQICSILFNGGGPADIAQEYPYMKGFILERNIKQAQGYGMERFKRGILAIDATELEAKNSGAEPEFLADLLIVKLTQR